MKRIAILGSTGSIGQSTLSICESYPDRFFSVVTMAAGSNMEAAFAQCQRWKPKVMSVAAEADASMLRERLERAGLEEIEGRSWFRRHGESGHTSGSRFRGERDRWSGGP